MGKYKLSNVASEDLIRIHHYGVKQFGMKQADKYFESFFVHFELIAKNATVQIEGNRQVKRETILYNLDAIISVGYRVNSK